MEPTDTILKAILAATPVEEHDAVCAAWEGLMPDRREYLAKWSPSFIAGWLRGLVNEWDDDAPINALPEGGYVRRVAITHPDGLRTWVWCRVPTLAAQVGEVVQCDDDAGDARDARVAFSVAPDGFGRADAIVRP